MSRSGNRAPLRKIHRVRHRQPDQNQPGAGSKNRIITEILGNISAPRTADEQADRLRRVVNAERRALGGRWRGTRDQRGQRRFENIEGDKEEQQPQRQRPQALAEKEQAKLDDDEQSDGGAKNQIGRASCRERV